MPHETGACVALIQEFFFGFLDRIPSRRDRGSLWAVNAENYVAETWRLPMTLEGVRIIRSEPFSAAYSLD